MKENLSGELAGGDESVDRLTREGLLGVVAAARQLDLRVSVWTLLRWIRRGVGGHRLEALKGGGRWLTSVAALRRFLARRTRAALGRSRRAKTPSTSKAAARYLDSIGLGLTTQGRS